MRDRVDDGEMAIYNCVSAFYGSGRKTSLDCSSRLEVQMLLQTILSLIRVRWTL